MPFESEKQRRFMYAKHPGIARKWTEEEKAMKRKSLAGVAKATGTLTPVPLAPADQQKLTARKKKAKRFAEASAGLGLVALGAKAPSYAAAAAKRLPKNRPLAAIARTAPHADSISEHLVPISIGIGAAGSLNAARMAGQETKKPKNVVTAKAWDSHVSPSANAAYREMGQRKRRRYSDAAAYAGLGTLTGHVAGKGAIRAVTGHAGGMRLDKPVRLGVGGVAGAAAGLTGLAGYGAVRRIQEGRFLQQRRTKIKAKGNERLATVGKAMVRVPGVPRVPGIRPGGLMRTISGKVVTRRGAIPGSLTPTVRRIV